MNNYLKTIYSHCRNLRFAYSLTMGFRFLKCTLVMTCQTRSPTSRKQWKGWFPLLDFHFHKNKMLPKREHIYSNTSWINLPSWSLKYKVWWVLWFIILALNGCIYPFIVHGWIWFPTLLHYYCVLPFVFQLLSQWSLEFFPNRHLPWCGR